MLDLKTQQRSIMSLIKGGYQVSENDTDYIKYIASSPYLELTQEIVDWWREYRIEQVCPLTSTLLKKMGLFEKIANRMTDRDTNTHFIENIGTLFLDKMSLHDESIVSSVAQFERALIKVKKGSDIDYIIKWSQKPTHVIQSLISKQELIVKEENKTYKILVSANIPTLFRLLPDCSKS